MAIAGTVVSAAALLYACDPSRCAFYPICLFHQLTGLMCPGCGALRALHQLLHGHLIAAFRFNPLLVLSLPGIGLMAASNWARARSGQAPFLVQSTKWLWVLVILALAFSVWRNIPGSPFAILPQ